MCEFEGNYGNIKDQNFLCPLGTCNQHCENSFTGINKHRNRKIHLCLHQNDIQLNTIPQLSEAVQKIDWFFLSLMQKFITEGDFSVDRYS